MGPSPLAQDQSHRIISDSRTPTPPSSKEGAEHSKSNNGNNKINNATTTRLANGTSQASTIPSIGSLMNGASADDTDAKSDISTRSGSRSPGGTAKKKDGPKDIPSDKLGFGEDMRALRVLDKAFKT